MSASAFASQKTITFGTHRSCPPDVTMRKIEKHFDALGITRVADVTGLDDIGIPVCQAVRPNSRTLSVSQGKGVTLELAMVSAAMESIELWHAEEAEFDEVYASIWEMEDNLSYRVSDLALRKSSTPPPGLRLSWVRATSALGGDATWLPRLCVGLDSTDQTRWVFPLFYVSSNGLASGNTWEEAVVHALCELLERDALARAGHDWRGRRLHLTGLDEGCASLVERFERSDTSVVVRDLSDLVGLPCFEAAVWSRTLPHVFAGAGCHLDAEVALSRALTEAAQSRLTLIAGARDDIAHSIYAWLGTRRKLSDPLLNRPAPTRLFTDVESLATSSFAEDVRVLNSLVRHKTGHSPLVVDLSRPEIGIPVVRVVAPGLQIKDGA
nr:YcaO-like family protein [Kibdelosporangium sp. MJ126-NF4]CEL18103.1 FIG00820054: hypothetical protein [Kibdelosporangium sp. MJ126-NF4]CTQ90668.1 FIG00820054: hypothetical protein [Kibdelosporangium sp. MJ126-NF4]